MSESGEVSYPQPPWRMSGRLWMVFPRTVDDVDVPGDLSAVGGRRRAAVGLVRYETGTVVYDELAVGVLVRRGLQVGILATSVWVNDSASLWGGRRMWGVPKYLATFDWDGPTVSIRRDGQLLAELTVGASSRWRVPLPSMPSGGFGEIDGQRVHLPARLKATAGSTRVDIRRWEAPLPALAETEGLRAFAANPCRFTFPAGRVVGAAEPSPTTL
ncbi:acetoacetate decarboxylase family protein [Kibdelosporangium philippinense]|uniref:Acetoacetate decarboxylase family protein n=1 Tax=Kibdelosporangium philippinense TaxID=211113 RepID=A0ABS8ZK84_9PSEU|nr:acetoacetate decarboxylase family protein [Kibdelosporangium philippinense]MCE7008220.1 acetoacetate decarboxylase family protein [Kibdelosporangium philippinense]